MANGLYDKGRNRFAKGEILWKATGGSSIQLVLVDTANYTPDLANHEFLSDIPEAARKGNSGGALITNMPALTLLDPVAGVCDANDVTVTSVPSGSALEAFVLFKNDSDDPALSPLICYVDTASGLPVTPNGENIVIQFDNGANKIFKL